MIIIIILFKFLLDFDRSNLKKKDTMASADTALIGRLNFQVGCQDRLRVNLGTDEALA